MSSTKKSTTPTGLNPMTDETQNAKHERKRHLPLSRKAGEAIQIDGPALVEVRRIGRSRVTLLIHAAEETNVVRKELTVLTPEKS